VRNHLEDIVFDKDIQTNFHKGTVQKFLENAREANFWKVKSVIYSELLVIYLFICCLPNDAFSRWTTQRHMDEWQMNNNLERIWKEVVVAWSRHNPGIFLERLRKFKKHLSHDSRCHSRDSIRGLLEYEARNWPLRQFLRFLLTFICLSRCQYTSLRTAEHRGYNRLLTNEFSRRVTSRIKCKNLRILSFPSKNVIYMTF
jgi:hypothetical protein